MSDHPEEQQLAHQRESAAISEINRRRERVTDDDGVSHTVYSGRLLNLCLEAAIFHEKSQHQNPSDPPLRLSYLARTRYVRERIAGGCA